jgi:hypothetical protein
MGRGFPLCGGVEEDQELPLNGEGNSISESAREDANPRGQCGRVASPLCV